MLLLTLFCIKVLAKLLDILFAGNCDNCISSKKERDMSKEAFLLMACMLSCRSRRGLNMHVDILRGSRVRSHSLIILSLHCLLYMCLFYLWFVSIVADSQKKFWMLSLTGFHSMVLENIIQQIGGKHLVTSWFLLVYKWHLTFLADFCWCFSWLFSAHSSCCLINGHSWCCSYHLLFYDEKNYGVLRMIIVVELFFLFLFFFLNV